MFFDLGFLSEKKPSQNQYQCAVIFGATQPVMKERFEYLVSLLDNGLKINEIYLLTGNRTVDAKKYHDGPNDYIQKLQNQLNIAVVSEKELMEDLNQKICQTNTLCKEKTVISIHSDKQEKRANTLDTLRDFAHYENSCNEMLYIF